MAYLTPKQRDDIKNSLLTIKGEIETLFNETMVTDYQLLYFYEELKRKSEFGYTFIKCAQMCDDMQNGREIKL